MIDSQPGSWRGIAEELRRQIEYGTLSENTRLPSEEILAIQADVADADASDFDALVLLGGVVNADHLRMDQDAVAFAKAFFDASKPVSVICHGAWVLVEADVVKGRTLTSYPSLRTDLRNAGATWVDQQVTVDHGLVSSRTPDDLPAFNAKTVEEIAEGRHA